MLATMQGDVLAKLSKFESQALANTCWGLAASGAQGQDTMAVAKAVASRVFATESTWTRNELERWLPQILCAHLKLGVQSDALAKLVVTRLHTNVGNLNYWGLSALAWSFRQVRGDGGVKMFLIKVEAELSSCGVNDTAVADAVLLGPGDWFDRYDYHRDNASS